MNDIEIRDDRERNRFVADIDGETATVRYTLDEDRIRLTHTRVPPALEGRGIGSRLARHALDSARDRGLRVWPDCPFIGSYIRRHPEYLELVDEAYPQRAQLEGDGERDGGRDRERG